MRVRVKLIFAVELQFLETMQVTQKEASKAKILQVQSTKCDLFSWLYAQSGVLMFCFAGQKSGIGIITIATQMASHSS